MDIAKSLSHKAKQNVSSTPVFFDLQNVSDRQKLEKFLRNKHIQYVSDDYEEQLREYFAIMNPTLVFDPAFHDTFGEYKKLLESKHPLWQHGKWVYFPWLSTVVHILDKKEFQHVRTARNRNLINEKEQEKFYNATIGIAGLSV